MVTEMDMISVSNCSEFKFKRDIFSDFEFVKL